MRTQSYLPVGEKGNFNLKLITKGTVVHLITGEDVTFVEMQRVNWIGRHNGKGIRVPIYRDHQKTTPYIQKVLGTDTSVLTKSTSPDKLKFGDLFFLEGHKETFMFLENKTKKSGRPVIFGRDLASGKNYNIAMDMTMVKIDLNKLKKDLKTV